MENGTVCNVVFDRGFGFIATKGDGDVFFHFTDLEGLEFDEQLKERRVTFSLTTTDRGLRAKCIQAAE